MGTSVSELEGVLSFVNPVSENWVLKSNFRMESVSIYNMLGQIILFNDKIFSKEFFMNTKSWEPGNYILFVKTEQGSISKSILKI